MEGFLLRLQAQFPSTVSTVYRCVCARVHEHPCRGRVVGAEPQPDRALHPVCHTLRTSEKLVKAPRDGCAAGPRCLLCMCTLDVDAAGLCGGGGAPASGRRGRVPRGSSAFLRLQIVPRLSGPRPPVSPRRSPPPHGLGLEHPQRWAAPRTAARGLGPAGGKARPVLPPRPAPRSCPGRGVALPGPNLGGHVQLCSRREDSRARVIERLCYGCRANMKDVVSGSRPRVVTGEVHPRGSVPHGPSPMAPHPRRCSLSQPSLDLLPPYILAEAQLRSQRYRLAT